MNRLTCSPRPDTSTEILIGAGIRGELAARVAQLGEDRQVVALIDDKVASAHEGLAPPAWYCLAAPGGEGCKSFDFLQQVLRQMIRWQVERGAVLVAVGGGSVGDLGGLAASLYLRGIELVQVPTTLLSMLDSSVGGKTAVNLPEGKNLVGTFWPPTLMLADLDFLSSLPEAELLSGLGEALKMGIGFNADLFALLESERKGILAAEPELLTQVVTMAVRDKIATVESDPHEHTGQRRRLNLGHTLAHALEAMNDYSLLHGHAVAQGLHFALDVAARRSVLAADQAERCHVLLDSYGFGRQRLPSRDELLPYFMRDKKMEGGQLHFVLPTAIGACRTFPIAPEKLC